MAHKMRILISKEGFFSHGFKNWTAPPLAFLVVRSCVVITLPLPCFIFFFVTSILPASRLLK